MITVFMHKRERKKNHGWMLLFLCVQICVRACVCIYIHSPKSNYVYTIYSHMKSQVLLIFLIFLLWLIFVTSFLDIRKSTEHEIIQGIILFSIKLDTYVHVYYGELNPKSFHDLVIGRHLIVMSAYWEKKVIILQYSSLLSNCVCSRIIEGKC